jgi:hypothetical protein
MKIWTGNSANKGITKKLQIKLAQITEDAVNDICYVNIPGTPIKKFKSTNLSSFSKTQEAKLRTFHNSTLLCTIMNKYCQQHG